MTRPPSQPPEIIESSAGRTRATMKTCNRCKIEKPRDDFYKDVSRPDGLLYHCIACHKVYTSAPHILARRRAQSRTPEARRKSFAWAMGKRGITIARWNEMLIAQSGRCGSCGDPMPDPFVDHDHVTGVVRELVCSGCNAAEGFLRGDPERALMLATYMRRHAA